MESFSRIRKILTFAYYLKITQIVCFIYATIKRKLKLYKIPVPKNIYSRDFKTITSFIFNESSCKKEEIMKGYYTFNGKRRYLGFPPDWNSEHVEPAWQFHLNAFNFLHLLEMNEKVKICEDWIDNSNESYRLDNPYVVALRITFWIKNKVSSEKILKSIYEQASYLYRNTEFYLPGNHYLENARTLILAGLYLKGDNEIDKWRSKGLAIIESEIPKQVLADGGYFERSFTYHSIALLIFLDILNILPSKYPIHQNLKAKVELMMNFLASVTHPDGKIALFNDSTFEITPDTKQILNYAEKITGKKPFIKNSFDESGFYRYEDENIFFIIKGSRIGPDNLIGHAHADIFSYELSLNSERIIVDSGVYSYDADEMRQYCRSTRAHNTVTIDDCDQAELWGSFRVGKRYKPTNVTFHGVDDEVIFTGNFAGYSKLIGDEITHNRTLTIKGKEKCIYVEDIVNGNGKHLAKSYIHLHPDVKVNSRTEYSIELKINDATFTVTSDINKLNLEEGFYSPLMGHKEKNYVIVLSERCVLPVNLRYRIEF